MPGNRASTPLSSVEGSECDPSDLQHREHDIALQAISALRATLGDQQPDERQRSPDAPTTAFDMIDEDEDSPHANADQTPHSTTRVGDESADIDSKTLQAIWSTSANDGTPVESVGDAAIEIVAQSFEKRDPDTPPFVVAVQALDPRTTTRSLFETFFPMGCARAVVYSRDEDVTGIMHTAAIAIMNAEGKDLENPLPVPYPVAGFTRRRMARLLQERGYRPVCCFQDARLRTTRTIEPASCDFSLWPAVCVQLSKLPLRHRCVCCPRCSFTATFVSVRSFECQRVRCRCQHLHEQALGKPGSVPILHLRATTYLDVAECGEART